MYSSPVPSPPSWQGPSPNLDRARTTTSSPPPTSPTSPSRSSRLRGLNYLRNYTQNHILSRDSNNNHSSSSSSQPRPSTFSRATSYPSPTTPARGSASASSAASPPQNTPRQTSPTAQRSITELPSATARSSNPENLGSTSGWLPTVGGHSGVSRIATEPQSTATASSSAVLSGNGSSAVTSDLSASMARTRSATVGASTDMPQADGSQELRNEAPAQNGAVNGKGMSHQLPSIRFTPHQDPRATRPSLAFNPMARILPTGSEIIKVGRYSERDNQPTQAANVPSAAPVGFKSKVVSRRHCEFWCSGGRWYIKDVKSSSGTFLNHIRLSSPGTESKPYPVNDGDIVQLGIDFKGGEEMIFRCVKIRVELNKGWQNGPSSFNVQSHKRLRELNNLGRSPASGSSQDCSICLGPIAPCQSLFVAPCSHTWHYKCIRVIINGPHWPHFVCPNCRSVADLEAELDDPYANGEWEEAKATDDDSAPAENAESGDETRDRRAQQQTSEATTVLTQEDRNHTEQDRIEPINEEAEASDGSELSQGAQAAEELGYLNIDEAPSPSESADSQPHQISNSTVAPVDIISRKPVASSAAGTTSRLEQLEPRRERNSLTRTPSPHGTSSSLDVVAGTEGPMTPRNDIGPFVFDGSAGRASGVRMAAIATMNLNAAADTPPPQLTPRAPS
ncbi:hypothetical protein G7Y89_g10751 [Cudoniella acicularis]|uniref:RING-type E3 ubiquitin transferase n=1 Tax=Cudoniella acicularis TaxID=354080 RepID=A0A8H4RDP2_9HELO|nr:hypothetical protein G7Y89_g10751 [Cudoniella acicularis]